MVRSRRVSTPAGSHHAVVECLARCLMGCLLSRTSENLSYEYFIDGTPADRPSANFRVAQYGEVPLIGLPRSAVKLRRSQRRGSELILLIRAAFSPPLAATLCGAFCRRRDASGRYRTARPRLPSFATLQAPRSESPMRAPPRQPAVRGVPPRRRRPADRTMRK